MVSETGRLICRLAEDAANAVVAAEALGMVRALREQIDEFEREQVARALSAGESFGDVGRALGISRQAVHRRFRKLAPKRHSRDSVPPTAEARLLVEYARREAHDLAAPAVGSEHLVLGMLRIGDPHAAAALDGLGVDLASARIAARAIAAIGHEDTRGPHEIQTVLSEALREATARRDRFVGTEHILLGALHDRQGGAALMLGALGVRPEAVRTAVDAVCASTP